MAGRCGCTGAGGCSCVIADSDTVTRTGTGSTGSPFQFHATASAPLLIHEFDFARMAEGVVARTNGEGRYDPIFDANQTSVPNPAAIELVVTDEGVARADTPGDPDDARPKAGVSFAHIPEIGVDHPEVAQTFAGDWTSSVGLADLADGPGGGYGGGAIAEGTGYGIPIVYAGNPFDPDAYPKVTVRVGAADDADGASAYLFIGEGMDAVVLDGPYEILDIDGDPRHINGLDHLVVQGVVATNTINVYLNGEPILSGVIVGFDFDEIAYAEYDVEDNSLRRPGFRWIALWSGLSFYNRGDGTESAPAAGSDLSDIIHTNTTPNEPTVAAGIGAGTVPSGELVSPGSSDSSGFVTLTTDADAGVGILLEVTFDAPFPNGVNVIILPANADTAAVNAWASSEVDGSAFQIRITDLPPPALTALAWTWVAIGLGA